MPDYYGDSGDGSRKRTRYERLRSALWSDRASFDAHWQDIATFMNPRRTRFWSGDRNRGDKRYQNIIDSTGRMAARTLQSGLHAGLTSPARPWFKLTTPDTKLAERKNVAEWLEVVTERMQIVFADSNLYNVLPIVYGDMGCFGTAAMSMVEDKHDLFRCYAYPLGSYALGLDERNKASTFIRDYELTVEQVVKEFGVQANGRDIDWTNISTQVHQLWDAGDRFVAVKLVWVVGRNDDADPRRLGSKYLPFTSCHYEHGSNEKKFLRESGFSTFPIMAPRWDVTGEDTYGTDCPGMTALGDVKQLQIMQKRKGQAIAKMVDPPLVGLPELRSQKTSLLAGDITYVREPQHGLKAIHEIALNLEHLLRDMGETQYRVQRAFYEDLFLMLARSDDSRGMQPITAREIDERHEEKLLALGPVLERTNDELLDPIVERAFLIMQKNGLIPDAPQELQGVDLKVEYISIMAAAQKLVGVVAQDRFMQSVGQMAEVFPGITAKIDTNRVVDNYGTMLGVDPRIVRSDDDANAIVQKQQQVAQNQADAENAQKMADAAKSAAAAPMGRDTALDRIVSNTVGQGGVSGQAPGAGA